MNLIQIGAVIMFFVAYLLITLEHKIGQHKSAIALSLAGALWILTAFVTPTEELRHITLEAGAEVFEIVAFLLSAMTLVEILIHYRLFDIIRVKLAKMKFGDKKQFLIIGFLTFFLSAVLDNLTITIVMTQIARRFFRGKNLLVAVAGIVVLANAGGAWSPIGDVTTIMLWLADKFSALEVIRWGFLPSATLGVIAASLMVRNIDNTMFDVQDEQSVVLTKGEKSVISIVLMSFTLPLVMNVIGLPPYMGLMIGLGAAWMFIEFAKTRSRKETHLSANIDGLLQKTDISSLQFFIGILLAVSALHSLGILEVLSHIVFGADPSFARLVGGNTVLGLLSAIVDNVPLTALVIDIMKVNDPVLWVLTALAVGTGGSALAIGSVAGVVAMGMVKELTFGAYLKYATVPALIGYAAAIGVWYLQYSLLG